ncbi:LytTR family DNA-binding domain-containing protein [Aestuariivita sp.]|jgi:hypothetical protein|uniref:LytTR family DNA-binding domain-containing protein n=1 Tax=Aestuariivita sp. TaxID=1872407 RepID=UPI002172EFDD|nr:LytTR family DNA-binding domain-containing protein [Aestuariivita sp.]MCE8007788.1 LytTR family transcriptional regulator [Aestuariivita sp.]
MPVPIEIAIPTWHGEPLDMLADQKTAQHHYVVAATTDGSATLSGSLSDCVDRLKGFEGMQCHRSH